jgi:hypothetical protein
MNNTTLELIATKALLLVTYRFKEFKTDKGFTKALEWVKKIEPNCAWAIEGAYSYGF